MLEIQKFYNIEQIKRVTKLNVKSINKLYILETINNTYLIKYYIPKFHDLLSMSLGAQALVSDNLRMAPQIVCNKNNELYTNYENTFFSLQKFVNGENFLLNDSTLDTYLEAMSKMHELLNQAYSGHFTGGFSENYTRIELINKIVSTGDEYRKIKKKNCTYEQLLDVREKIVKEIPSIEYALDYTNVIHGDLRPSNVLWDGNNINFIDFDYISQDDLLYEISSSITLLSKFDINVCKKFWNKYSTKYNVGLTFKDLYMHLLSYYVKSNFPLSIMSYETQSQIDRMSLERLNMIDFCHEIVAN